MRGLVGGPHPGDRPDGRGVTDSELGARDTGLPGRALPWRFPRSRSSTCWQRGDNDKAERAEGELPDKVDPERDSGILDRLGIDPKDLLGGLGGAAGKLGL